MQTKQIKLLNPELGRHFFVQMPEFVSRKMVQDIKPLLDKLAEISRNISLEKYFMQNAGILEYISMTGTINATKVKEICKEMGIDASDKKAYQQGEEQVRAELMKSYPGIISAMKTYDLEVDPSNDEAWQVAVQLIRKTGIVKQEVDKDLIENHEDANDDFWSSQSVEEVGNYAQFFRKYCS